MPKNFENINMVVFDDHKDIARAVANRIATLINEKNAQGKNTVLGLATGSTPLGIYRELIQQHREEGLDFSRVVTFNLDEYYPMDPDSIHSYYRYMRENFFDYINIQKENIHIPRGDIPEEEVEDHCRDYEEKIAEAGGIDLQILGIGRTGHIGFNEPGSARDSRTRLIFIDTITRKDAASDFFGEDNVPMKGITMGVATIMEAREISLIALGELKAAVIKKTVEGDVDPQVAASYLQEHPDATIFLEPATAAELTRYNTPWLLGVVDWNPQRELEAVIWLSEQVNKSILRLETKDYRDHHLSSLIARWGTAAPLNGEVFNALISKIRGRSKLPQEKRILVFSPHPDDDVIAMGGILHKLHQNDNEIVVAYQTSGNIAVFDHEVRRYLDFIQRAKALLNVPEEGVDRIFDRIETFLASKQPGDVDILEVQSLKKAIREAEAVSAIETLGLRREQAKFLNLPFYQTGKVRKDPIGVEDVEITLDLMKEVRPEIIFAAGDISDPHGTHRMCMEAIELALERYTGPAPEVWKYRGAWEEWPVGRASILVPLSEEELRLKILAIFKHQSQKDKAPFPGPEEREFWQQVEDRNKGLAQILERLGLPAYYAIETYVVEQEGRQVYNPIVSTSALASDN